MYRTNAQSRLLEERMVVEGIPYHVVGGVNFYARQEIRDIVRNDSDYVASVTVGGAKLRGNDLRTILSLRSPSFTVEYKDNAFTFHVTGYEMCIRDSFRTVRYSGLTSSRARATP